MVLVTKWFQTDRTFQLSVGNTHIARLIQSTQQYTDPKKSNQDLIASQFIELDLALSCVVHVTQQGTVLNCCFVTSHTAQLQLHCNSQCEALITRLPVMMTPIGQKEFNRHDTHIRHLYVSLQATTPISQSKIV